MRPVRNNAARLAGEVIHRRASICRALLGHVRNVVRLLAKAVTKPGEAAASSGVSFPGSRSPAMSFFTRSPARRATMASFFGVGESLEEPHAGSRG